MFDNNTFKNSRSLSKGWLFFLSIAFVLFAGLPGTAIAHPSPNSLIFLDLSPKKVMMEVQIPLTELELSFKPGIAKTPETFLASEGTQLKEYLLAHIHAYAIKDHPWLITITNLKMDQGKYPDSNVPYWEVNVSVMLTPQDNTDSRNFYLDYDAVIHQVMNHAALVSIRSDWENGNVETGSGEVQAIGWNLENNTIPPLHVNPNKGSWWTGFISMVTLGVRHIAEGTDHLMFLLVLLLPATLLVKDKEWNRFGGTRYSILRLLKIVTAFTIGHSLTLLSGAFGWVRLPSQPVEILIAFSILVSAVHALRPLFPGKEMFVAAGFGLIHGLAFASTLSNLHLDTVPMVLSILGFNIGIELMQLFVIGISVPWLIILSRKAMYRYVRITGAVFAAIAAIAWMLQRYLQRSNPFSTIVDQIAGQGKWIIAGIALLAIMASVWPKQKQTRVPAIETV
ncbi:HupE/UreJ family protein [Chitinophaga filiformis]|uniref:HupE / UreJ protein n=1 Tax=Chitinophaga filiformis TaxID=104663 RepID=A0A1G7MBF0_CHIFI|nr:HupE/UreJ family protein [Chitinophaga filiformis]SDF58924.1 HupE / UreJ protein [Chitinophaga filiformis]